jgi:methenyltetrahydrofolate cyclohydrolase
MTSDQTTDFSTLTLRQYTDILSSDAPSPGGGSAAALVAVLGVSLVEMVCRLNAKRKSNTNASLSQSHSKAAEEIRQKLLPLMTQDAQSFDAVMKVWKEKGEALQKALGQAMNVPLETADLCVRAMKIGETEIQSTSMHLISDLAESGHLLLSAFKSALLNVEINLRSLTDQTTKKKTNDIVKELTRQAETIGSTLQKSFS